MARCCDPPVGWGCTAATNWKGTLSLASFGFIYPKPLNRSTTLLFDSACCRPVLTDQQKHCVLSVIAYSQSNFFDLQ